MAKTPTRKTPAHAAFIAYLYSYYKECGEPKYKYIIELAPKLNELYPPENSDVQIEINFTESGLSQLLKGARDALPSAATLAALILALQHLATVYGNATCDRGRSALPEWQELLRQAKKRAEQQARDGVFVDEEGSDDEAPGSPNTLGGTVPSPRQIHRADPVRLTPGELTHLMTHGPYAQTLAARGADGDPMAVYEIAVILSCNPEYSAKALAYAINAGAAGVDSALELVDVDQDRVDLRLSEKHARALAETYAQQGADQAHHTFRSCATQAWAVSKAILRDGSS